jgi:hypothetical protein
MKGDFSRDTFDLDKDYSSVLMQQGRVLLDADWNEQTTIILNYLRTLAVDLIGQHGSPDNGFTIGFLTDNIPERNGSNLTIAPGRYYVDGIPCNNPKTFRNERVTYHNQPYYENKNEFPDFPFLVYLDVWERHVTSAEVENLAEVALGGIDTTTRTQVVWQVKTRKLGTPQLGVKCKGISFPPESNGLLIADIPSNESYDDPCNIEPDAKFRGAENQLYRVEIHTGNEGGHGRPTFKWSRENGSVVFPIIKLSGDNNKTKVWLENLGRDDKFTLRKDDWVEIVDDNYTLQNRAERLLQVSDVDRDERRVTLDGKTQISASEGGKNHPLLRRWDQKAGNSKEGGLTLSETDNAAIVENENKRLKLEDGIIIQFPTKGDGDVAAIYRTGDYWLISARTATGDIEWAKDSAKNPLPQRSRGIKHHYAPLGIVTAEIEIDRCRCQFKAPCSQDNIPQGAQKTSELSTAEKTIKSKVKKTK